MTPYAVRAATERDAATIAGHRVNMFRDMGHVPSEALAATLLETSTTALAGLLREGSYVGWLAVVDGTRVIAGAGAHIQPQLPRIADCGSKVALAPVPLVVNVYTEPAFRGRGIARALMTTLMQWATEQGCHRVQLHASEAGRPLYHSLGFVATNEMRWSPGG